MIFALASFLIIALLHVEALVLFGVVCASIASGFGELTYLSLTSRYHKSTVTAWSSGTGAAGVAGALLYALLKTFLSPRNTLLVQLFCPLLMFISYLFILGPMKPAVTSGNSIQKEEENKCDDDVLSHLGKEDDKKPLLKNSSIKHARFDLKLLNKDELKYWWGHVKFIPHLFKYMVPLFLVYVAEYSINQGFFELLYNPNTHIGGYCMNQQTQYRWLQVAYQVGVLIARSSTAIIHIKHFWILAILQVCIVPILMMD